ncbi:MAG: hypothetical protein ACXABI_10330 [Candidatus Hodarchaeales archaeon]
MDAQYFLVENLNISEGGVLDDYPKYEAKHHYYLMEDPEEWKITIILVVSK